ILSYIEGQQAAPSAERAAQPAQQQQQQAQPAAAAQAPSPAPSPAIQAYRPGDRVEIVPMTPIRKRTAEHMIASRRTSAHVTSVFEIDMTRIAKLREQHKDRFFERHGVKLTFTPFIIK